MTGRLVPGLVGEYEFTVQDKHMASAVGSGLVDVFSTAMMIAGMEAAAVKTIQPYLEEGMTSVGVHVDVSHKAATPAGLKARFRATLKEISPSGRSFLFHVEASDGVDLIGEGEHRRVLINREEFERKTRQKLERACAKEHSGK